LGGESEVEVAAGGLPPPEQAAESEPLLLLVEHHQVVLHLEPSDDRRRRRRAALLPLHLHHREARRVVAHLRHRVAAEHRPVLAALQHQVDLRHGVAQPRRPQIARVVAQLERRRRRRRRRDALPAGGGPGERVDHRSVHVRPERRVRDPRAQLDDERLLGVELHLLLVHGDLGRRDEVSGEILVAVEGSFAGERRRHVGTPRREEEERAAAEDRHAVAAAAAGEAERELVGDLLRPRHLRLQREPGAREPGDADGAGGELREEGIRRAGGDGGERHRVERVLAVGGVRRQPRPRQVGRRRLAGEGVVRVGGALAPERVLDVGAAIAIVGASRRVVAVRVHAEVVVALQRRVRGGARHPDERAGEVEDERAAVLDGDGVERGRRVLGDGRDKR
ncbi:Os01g0937025, partial [Oryza sativa Japonica Group]